MRGLAWRRHCEERKKKQVRVITTSVRHHWIGDYREADVTEIGILAHTPHSYTCRCSWHMNLDRVKMLSKILDREMAEAL